MIFVSHANPEDDEFSRWLTLQLANEGYPVWCDLTKLLGGEVFWTDIEKAVRDDTAKFVWVLSRNSNDKAGARNELSLALGQERAQKLKDFVIPAWIDDLRPDEFNAEIGRKNAIPFNKSWAHGLASLLKKLKEDGVARRSNFGPASVSTWWRGQETLNAGITERPETLVSNWYPLRATTLYFHELTREQGSGILTVPDALSAPAVQAGRYLVSFADAGEFAGKLGHGITISASHQRRINDSARPDTPRLWASYREERATLTQLLRQAWQKFLLARGLPTHEFANKALAFYFVDGTLEKNRAPFVDHLGGKSWRAVVGTKALKGVGGVVRGHRHWHFCLEAKPTSHPVVGYTMKAHVLFSDDGKNIWSDAARLHRARRSQCKGWWNDMWRDRIAGSAQFLAEDGAIKLPVGADLHVMVDMQPIVLECPISFDESALDGPEGDVVAPEQDDWVDDDESATDEGEI
jgi:hypothetical protein